MERCKNNGSDRSPACMVWECLKSLLTVDEECIWVPQLSGMVVHVVPDHDLLPKTKAWWHNKAAAAQSPAQYQVLVLAPLQGSAPKKSKCSPCMLCCHEHVTPRTPRERRPTRSGFVISLSFHYTLVIPRSLVSSRYRVTSEEPAAVALLLPSTRFSIPSPPG